MLQRTVRCLVWLGGSAQLTALGTDARPKGGQFVNVVPEGNQSRRNAMHFNPTPLNQHLLHEFAEPEIRQTLSRLPEVWPIPSRYSVQLRADVYDELLKLPLRYALHDFKKLQAHLYAYKTNNTSSTHEHNSPMEREKHHEEIEISKTNNMNSGTNWSTSHELTPSDEIAAHPGFYRFRKPLSLSNKNAKRNVIDSANNNNKSNDEENESTYSVLDDVYGVAGRVSGVGYAPPLGPVDPLDTIAFFVHRTSNGNFAMRVRSMNLKNLMPSFYLQIGLIDGDIFRFEEELMKLFPTKKIFTRRERVFVYNVNFDGLMVVRHWLLGLGF